MECRASLPYSGKEASKVTGATFACVIDVLYLLGNLRTLCEIFVVVFIVTAKNDQKCQNLR